MLDDMRALQKKCFPTPDRKKETQDIKNIHQELKGRLRFGERARLQCLVDKMTALRKLETDDSFAAGFEMGWRVRGDLQTAGIVCSAREGSD